MFLKKLSFLLPLLMVMFVFSCGKSSTSDNKDTKKDEQVTQILGKEKSVEIQCSGMTCEGCKNTIENKVKKVNGIRKVDADFNTNKVIATFDDGRTNVGAIKTAIESAGYKVESVKE